MRWGVAKANGADLYFERRGDGPPVLLIVGGGGDCAAFSPLADLLAQHSTVISYDRRGNSRSTLHGPARPISLAEQSDDAVAVLEANGFARARVFGSSGGATTALDLSARHPEYLEAVVAHEPPVPRVLPDGDEVLRAFAEMDRTLHSVGWEAALTDFLAYNGLMPDAEELGMLTDPASHLPPGPIREAMERMARNWPAMLTYEVQPFITYQADLECIAGNGVRIALATGATTRDRYFHKAAVEVARRLDVECVEFPGGHTAAGDMAGLFAPRLREVFARLERA